MQRRQVWRWRVWLREVERDVSTRYESTRAHDSAPLPPATLLLASSPWANTPSPRPTVLTQLAERLGRAEWHRRAPSSSSSSIARVGAPRRRPPETRPARVSRVGQRAQERVEVVARPIGVGVEVLWQCAQQQRVRRAVGAAHPAGEQCRGERAGWVCGEGECKWMRRACSVLLLCTARVQSEQRDALRENSQSKRSERADVHREGHPGRSRGTNRNRRMARFTIAASARQSRQQHRTRPTPVPRLSRAERRGEERKSAWLLARKDVLERQTRRGGGAQRTGVDIQVGPNTLERRRREIDLLSPVGMVERPLALGCVRQALRQRRAQEKLQPQPAERCGLKQAPRASDSPFLLALSTLALSSGSVQSPHFPHPLSHVPVRGSCGCWQKWV